MPKIVILALFFIAIVLAAATVQRGQPGLGSVAIAEPDPISLSIDEIMLGTDVKSLPVQEIEDRSVEFPGASDQ